jgi:hypothetical protein
VRYLCLIYGDEQRLGALSPSESDALLEESLAYHEQLRRTGQFVAAEALHPAESGTTIRLRNGKILLTDGPFVETKEQVGGFFLIEARDLNEAIQVASRIPCARLGSIEVRPVMELKRR